MSGHGVPATLASEFKTILERIDRLERAARTPALTGAGSTHRDAWEPDVPVPSTWTNVDGDPLTFNVSTTGRIAIVLVVDCGLEAVNPWDLVYINYRLDGVSTIEPDDASALVWATDADSGASKGNPVLAHVHTNLEPGAYSAQVQVRSDWPPLLFAIHSWSVVVIPL